MRSIRTSRFAAIGVAAAVIGVGSVVAGPAQAGFFEQLFGGLGQQPAPSESDGATPGYGIDPQAPDALPARPRHKKKKVVALEDTKAERQQTTDLMHDKTLRRGDAVMMKDGIHVYAGPQSETHTTREFLPLDADRHVAKQERAQLAAADTTRNDPLRTAQTPDTIASGRSAAVGAPVSEGFKITDAHGNSIRYVGP